jgi:serine/threonine protein kinase
MSSLWSGELSYDVKLSDFGHSKCNEQDSLFSSVVAPPRWRAPEVFRDEDMISNKYTWSSDVYSFAMVCYEILSGDFPFQELLPGDLHEAICDGERPELPANCPDDLLELIHECWASNPDERPAISEIHQRLSTMAV